MNQMRKLKKLFCSNLAHTFCTSNSGNQISRSIATDLDLIPLRGKEYPLADIIKSKIANSGPMTFAAYMDLSLTHETHGYYMKRDVFNAKGDFITSPEISQLFGEMVGFWIVYFLQQSKILQPKDTNSTQKKWSLLEFGPGRGTLVMDTLRILKQFNLLDRLEINLIEVSPVNKKTQQQNLLNLLKKWDIWLKYDQAELSEAEKKRCESFSPEDVAGPQITLKWYSKYEEYIKDATPGIDLNAKHNPSPVIVLCHEFFDALPIHIFQYDKSKGWCEKLVNTSTINDKKKFEFILSDGPTEAVKKILNPLKSFQQLPKKSISPGDTIEISPQSLITMNSLSELIAINNGAILVIDYGESHALSNSIRGVWNHKYIPQEDLLEFPGEIDLSAYVNFLAIADVVSKTARVRPSQIIPQGLFLESMGINLRIENLTKMASKETIDRFESEYLRLVSPDQMGGIYKFLYVGREDNGEIFPFATGDNNLIYFQN